MPSPYILVDGTLSATLAGVGTELSIRTLAPKALAASEPDHWSDWQPLFSTPGANQTELGRPRFNGRDASIHGAYRFQIRVRVPRDATPSASAGLSALSMKLYFENGIMSIPPLFAGRNKLRLRIADPAALTSPLTVVYLYDTPRGPKSHRQMLRPSDFTQGEARYIVNAPDLIRCRSVSISSAIDHRSKVNQQ